MALRGVRDHRLPSPGTVLTRDHNGQQIAVRVLAGDFEYDGRTYRSLSAIAREVTGKSWNGYAFFGLTSETGNRKEAAAAAPAVETIDQKRERWRREYDERCAAVGFPEKGGRWDPDTWYRDGYDAMGDFLLQTTGKPWRPPGMRGWRRDQRNGAAHSERKKSRRKSEGKRAWSFR